MKRAALVVLALLAGNVQAGPLQRAQESYVKITDGAGDFRCGSTAIAPRTVVTAEHCIHPGMLVEGQMVSHVEYDGAEHALVVLSKPHGHSPAKLGGGVPKLGDELWMVGRPNDLGLLYRKGYYQGVADFPDLPGKPWRVVSFLVAGGDSGSGIYNTRGELVGTVSIQILPPDMFLPGWAPMGYTDYKFTRDQMRVVK